MKIKTYLFGLLVISLLAISSNAQGVSRTNRIYRPCPSSTVKAVVEVQTDGDIDLTPCVGRTVLVNGSPIAAAGSASLASTYSNSLSTAISTIGSTPTTLPLTVNAPCSTAIVIPATLLLESRNNAQIVKSPGCTITFQGIGITDPMSQSQLFSGFAVADVTWSSATDYPREISAELWGTAATTVTNKYNRADAAVLGKRCVIHVLTGTINGQSVITQYHTIKFGPGDFANITAVDYPFLLAQDTRFTGAGKHLTTIRESSDTTNVLSMRTIYSVAAATDPGAGVATGSTRNIEIDNIRIYSETDRQFDTSASAIFLGNVIGGSVHDVEIDSTHGFGIYVGGFATLGFYAENFSIYNCVFKNLGAQNTGVIQGKNIQIHHNIFRNIGRQVKLSAANGTVASASTTITSGTAGFFIPTHVGGTINITAGASAITLTIASYISPTEVTVNAAVGFTSSAAVFQIRSPFLSVADFEPNATGDILENVSFHNNTIDGRDAIHLFNGIVAQLGGGLATRNIRIVNNDVIGGDVPLNDTIIPTTTGSIGIILHGGDGSVVQGNNVRGMGQSGISIQNTVYSTISNNQLSIVGGGGLPAIEVIGSNNNVFSENTTKKIGALGSQSDSVLESEYTGTVNVAAASGGVSVLTLTGGQFFYPHNVRSKITVAGATYTITNWTNANVITIDRAAGGALSAQAYTSRYNNNIYKGTPNIGRSVNSYSTVQNAPESISYDVTSTGNSAGATTALKSFTVSSGTLIKVNDTYRADFAGRFAANTNADKRITLTLGGSPIFDTGALALNDKAWTLEFRWIYVSSSVQWLMVEFLADGSLVKKEMISGTASHTSDYAMTITGAGTGASDVTARLMQISKQQ